ncbi:MAG: hypothetical protein E7620_06000 [Ruminococcaceae bacterium]|nr:hypothetical protein [Oscillospiraceae bacterium]
MNWKRFLPMILLAVGVIFLVCAILVFAIAVPKANYTYKLVLNVICAILMLVVAGLCFLYWYLSRDTYPNFFLFDREKKRNIPVEKLKFSMVNDRMTFLLSQLAESEEELWKSDLLQREEDTFGYRSVYKPLVAYKVLFDLGEHTADSGCWKLFREAPRENLLALCKALEIAGEKKMADTFLLILDKYGDDNFKAKEFLRKNLGYIRSKMVSYVKKYIELFY